MNRPPASGSDTVIGPPSRSKTPAEYKVSRFERTTSCLSNGVSSRMCINLPNPLSLTTLYKSLSALVKLSADTSTAPSDVVRRFTIRTLRGQPVDDYRRVSNSMGRLFGPLRLTIGFHGT